MGIFCILWTTRYISERFDKGIIIKNGKIKKLLWMRKTDDYISYIAIVFNIIGYFSLIAIIVCCVVGLFILPRNTMYLSWIVFGWTFIVFFAECFFYPSYGARGS